MSRLYNHVTIDQFMKWCDKATADYHVYRETPMLVIVAGRELIVQRVEHSEGAIKVYCE
jgi:hypothetical protein